MKTVVFYALSLLVLASYSERRGGSDSDASRLIERCDGSLTAARVETVAEAEFRVARLGGGALCLDGDIVFETIDRLFELETEPAVLVVRSYGGLAGAGLELGERLRAAETSLIVWDHCLSACAPYLFVGATRRIVFGDGVVGWHAGFPRTRFEALLQNADQLSQSQREIARYAFERYREAGRFDIPDRVWLDLPREVTQMLSEDSGLRIRIERLYAQAQIDPAILSAYNVIYRRAPDFIDQSPGSPGYGLQTFWTPGQATLEAWGFDQLHMDQPDSAEQVFLHGLNLEPPRTYVRMAIAPEEAPRPGRSPNTSEEEAWPQVISAPAPKAAGD